MSYDDDACWRAQWKNLDMDLVQTVDLGRKRGTIKAMRQPASQSVLSVKFELRSLSVKLERERSY